SRTDSSRTGTWIGPASIRAALPTISKQRQHRQRVLLGMPGTCRSVVDETRHIDLEILNPWLAPYTEWGKTIQLGSEQAPGHL
ncbi:MAG TPA: hypothetical protein V6D03_13325, partial [Candidatus Caenarcaniphilales bacterium]